MSNEEGPIKGFRPLNAGQSTDSSSTPAPMTPPILPYPGTTNPSTPVTGQDLTPQVICSKCGFPSTAESRFCGACGASLPTSPVAQNTSYPASKPSHSPSFPPPPPPYQAPNPVRPPTSTHPPQPAANAYGYAVPGKDRSIALILEILPGLFGLLGFGWMYAGNTSAGVGWLIGFLLWTIFATALSVITAGIGAICWLPISIGLIAISATSLNKFTRSHTDLFKP